MTGAVLSTTVTVLLQVLEFPAASRTVITTVLGPLLAQVKLLLLSERMRLPEAVQLSVDPLLTSDARSVAFPVPSRTSVLFLQMATGASFSRTVTVKLQGLLVFPLASVAV